jgi:hypothetical protein
VYFLNPPNQNCKEPILIKEHDGIPNLNLIDYRLSFPYMLRFHFRALFDFLMRFQLKKIKRFIKSPVDIVWNFDFNLYTDPTPFKADLNIYHPVDELIYPEQIKPGESADIIFSVTKEILTKFKHLDVPKYYVQHGLSHAFAEASKSLKQGYTKSQTTKVGYVGNLLIPSIDVPVFEQIISENPNIQFEFWGNYLPKESNIGGVSDMPPFVRFLQEKDNVKLHGPLPPEELAQAIQEMDAFLICYDVKRDYSQGTNSHKILEYLSTGKVIISNNFTNYKGRTDLINMVEDRNSNQKLPGLFSRVINNLEQYNSVEAMQKRQKYALENTYNNQIEKIERYIAQL